MSNNLKGDEEIDAITAIMEEMEAKTPKSEHTNQMFVESNEKLSEPKQVSDDVDARSVFSFLKKDPVKPGKSFPSVPTNEKYYDFTNSNVGQALIFNQVKIKGKEERKGSQKDADDLNKVLTWIGFDVTVYNDSTVDEIKKLLKKGVFLDFRYEI